MTGLKMAPSFFVASGTAAAASLRVGDFELPATE